MQPIGCCLTLLGLLKGRPYKEKHFSPISVWDMQFMSEIKWKRNGSFKGLFLSIPCPTHLHHSSQEKELQN